MSALVIPNGNRLQRGLSGDLWGKYPWYRAGLDPTYGTFKKIDFDPYLAEDWTARQLSSASGTITSQALRHGVARLSAAATTQWDGYQLQYGDAAASWFAPQTEGTICFEGLFELGAALTRPVFFFGLCTVAEDAVEDGSVAGTNIVGFYATGDDLNIDFLTKNGASSDTQTSVAAFTAGEWIKLGFEIHNDTRITPVVNGVRLVNNVVTDTSDIPDNTDWMVPTFSIANGAGSETTTLDVDWMAFWQSDKQDIVGT